MLMLNIVQIHQTDLEKNDQNVANRNLRIFENQLVITGHGIHTPFMANKMNHLAIRPGVVHKKNGYLPVACTRLCPFPHLSETMVDVGDFHIVWAGL